MKIFLHNPYFQRRTFFLREIHNISDGVLFLWMEKACFCVTLRVSILLVGVLVSSSWGHDTSLNIDHKV
jgi:hypothetical protein